MKKLVTAVLQKCHIEIRRTNKPQKLPSDFEVLHQQIYQKVAPFTMTSPERIYSLIEAVQYIVKNKIKGDIVECGVWKGGSMLSVAETFIHLNETERTLFLYDTFEGMSEPGEEDKAFFGKSAQELLLHDVNKENNLVWAYSTLDTVKATMQLSKYPSSQIKYIKGKVEDSIPASMPESIAILRLDTDWYESTKHELIHLFPLLTQGGVLILDDYGFWQGARKAADEYFAEKNIQILLNRIDETGRIAIKQ